MSAPSNHCCIHLRIFHQTGHTSYFDDSLRYSCLRSFSHKSRFYRLNETFSMFLMCKRVLNQSNTCEKSTFRLLIDCVLFNIQLENISLIKRPLHSPERVQRVCFSWFGNLFGNLIKMKKTSGYLIKCISFISSLIKDVLLCTCLITHQKPLIRHLVTLTYSSKF